MSKKPDGYILQIQDHVTGTWEVDPTEFPIESKRIAKERIQQLKLACPEFKWRAVPFMLGNGFSVE